MRFFLLGVPLLATQTISRTAFQTLLAEVADAIAAQSWATAKSKYAQAEAVMAALELETGDADSRIRFRESLEKLKTAIDAAKAEAQQESGSGGLAVAFVGSPEGF